MAIHSELHTTLRLKIVKMSGVVTCKEFLEYGNSINANARTKYDCVYIDVSEMSECEFGHDLMLPHVNRIAALDVDREFAEFIWAPNNLGYGMARMYASLIEQHSSVGLYKDLDELKSDLASHLKVAPSELGL